jgi:hypothetical protein
MGILPIWKLAFPAQLMRHLDHFIFHKYQHGDNDIAPWQKVDGILSAFLTRWCQELRDLLHDPDSKTP